MAKRDAAEKRRAAAPRPGKPTGSGPPEHLAPGAPAPPPEPAPEPAPTPATSTSPSPQPSWLPTLVGGGLAALLLLAYVLIKSYGLRPDIGDEAIYFYDAAATAAGRIPYRDFPLAHPPLHILVLAPLFWLFGPSVLLGKAMPVLFAALTGLVLLRLVRRQLAPALLTLLAPAGPAPAPPRPSSSLAPRPPSAAPPSPDPPLDPPRQTWIAWAGGLAALALYFGSYDLLRCSTHFTGANLGTLLALLALERLAAGRPAQAGLCTVLAGLTGFYAAPAPVAAALVLLLRQPRQLVRYLGVTVGGFLLANVVCYAVAGRAFLEQVYLFHLAKSAPTGGNAPLWTALVADNPWLVWAGLLGAGLVVGLVLLRRGPAAAGAGPGTGRDRRRERRALAASASRSPGAASSGAASPGSPPAAAASPGALLLAPVAGLLLAALAVASLQRVFTYYFAPVYALLAVLGGLLVCLAAAHLLAHRTPWRGGRVLPVALTALLAVGLLLLPERFDPSSPADQGQVKRYRFFEDNLLPALDPAVRALLWHDERALDRRYIGPTRYLWHESRYSEALPALAAHVAQVATPGDEVFGDSMSAPAVALLAGLRLAGDLADTNRQHYTSGVRRAADDLARVDSPRLRFVVCRGRVGVCGEPAVWQWITRDFARPRRFPDPRGGTALLLFERRTGAAGPG